jgi:hypothetical protein
MPTFQHPAVFSDQYRGLTLLDVIAHKCPLFDVIADFRRLPDDKGSHGWTGITVINGRLHRLRGGGARGGPRSGELFRRGEDVPGVYARDLETGRVLELLAKREATPPVRLDLLDAIPFGWLDVEHRIPGWDCWGDEPASPTTERTIVPDPMEPTEPTP